MGGIFNPGGGMQPPPPPPLPRAAIPPTLAYEGVKTAGANERAKANRAAAGSGLAAGAGELTKPAVAQAKLLGE